MKKFVASVVTIVAILGTTATPAFASVAYSKGTSVTTSSTQSQANTSTTPTPNKFISDGWIMID